MFNPDEFLNSAVTGSNDTKVIQVPVGEYLAIIEKIVPSTWNSKDGSKSGVKIDIQWAIQDPSVAAFTQRENPSVRQSIMLDTLPSGALDMSTGRNITLGRLREAVGKNNPDQPFTFSMLPGLMAKVSVQHREYQGDLFAEVKAASKI